MRCASVIIFAFISLLASGNPALCQLERQQVWIVLSEVNEEWGIHMPNQDRRTMPAEGTLFDGRNSPVRVGGQGARTVGAFKTPQNMSLDTDAAAMYFQIDDNFLFEAAAPVYVTIVYYDSGTGIFQIQYDAADTSAAGEPVPGSEKSNEFFKGSVKPGGTIPLLNTGKWVEITFELPDARFANRQRYDADIRLAATSQIFIHEVSISLSRPPNYVPGETLVRERIQRFLLPVPRMQQGFDVIVPDGITSSDTVSFDLEWIEVLAALGVTTIQTVILWKDIEKTPGIFDLSYHDSLFVRCMTAGLKWSIYIPWSADWCTPDWFKQSAESLPAISLVTGEKAGFQSPWNPASRYHAGRVLRIIGQRYGGRGLVRSLILGPLGESGSSGLVSAFDETAGAHAPNPGWWCGDSMAILDFRYYLQTLYPKVEDLNKAWNTLSFNFGSMMPVPPLRARSWQSVTDVTQWYTDTVYRLNVWWAQQARMQFPEAEIYFRIDGNGTPSEGIHWNSLLTVMSNNKGGGRIVLHGSSFRDNFSALGTFATGSKMYGSWTGFEMDRFRCSPASMYALLAASATFSVPPGRSLFIFPEALIAPETLPFYRSNVHFMSTKDETLSPLTLKAVLYPWDWFAITDAKGPGDGAQGRLFWKLSTELRDLFDFDFIDDQLIAEGILQRYRYLLMPVGRVWKDRTLERITEWVRRGGILIAPDLGTLESISQDRKFHDILFGSHGISGKEREIGEKLNCQVKKISEGFTIKIPGAGVLPEDSAKVNPRFLLTVNGIVHDTRILDERYIPYTVIDGTVDNVYAFRVRGGVIFCNDNDSTVSKIIERAGTGEVTSVTLPPYSISRFPVQ